MGGKRLNIDLHLGRKYGRLTIKEAAGLDKRRRLLVVCNCECGNDLVVGLSYIISGHTNSCGCYKKEQIIKAATTHGLSNKHPSLYKRWLNIKDRCFNPNNKRYHVYGGRGIAVCNEWVNDFETFCEWALANGYSQSLTIDRRDVNGDYSPDNCRWITNKEQQNNRTDNVFIDYNGITLTRQQWAEKTGIKYETLRRRYNNGLRGDMLFRPVIIHK